MSTVRTYTPLSRGLIINVLFQFTSIMYNKHIYSANVFIDARGDYRAPCRTDDTIVPSRVHLHPATSDDFFCHRYCGVPYEEGDFDG